jgi:hypothetical protein
MNVRTSFVVLFLAFFIGCTMNVLVPYANASSESPYGSRYDHGCDDAKYLIQMIDILTSQKKAQAFILMNS